MAEIGEEYTFEQIGVLDRPRHAVQALATANIPAAWRSILRPEELTPQERDTLLHRWGLDRGPFAPVFKVLTNPAFILTAALTIPFPIPKAQNIFKLSEKLGSLGSRIPVLRGLLSMQALFRGTDVPDIMGKIISDVHDFRSRYNDAFAQGLKKFQAATGRLPGRTEQVMVSAWLDGLHLSTRGWQGKNGIVKVGEMELPAVGALVPNLEKHMNRPLLELAQDVRGTLNKMFEDTWGNIDSRKRLAAALTRLKKAGFDDSFTDAMQEMIANPKAVPNYLPHRILQTEEDFRNLVKVLTAHSSERRFAEAAERKALTWLGPEAMKREYGMMPSLEDLARLGPIVDKGEVEKLQNIVKARILDDAQGELLGSSIRRLEKMSLPDILTHYGDMLQPEQAKGLARSIAVMMPPQYSMKMMPVLSSYTHTMAATYGWTVKGGGEAMIGQLDQLKDLARTGNKYAADRAAMLENTYIPVALGRGTFRQAIQAQVWDQNMLKLAEFLDHDAVKGVMGENLTSYLRKTLQQSKGAFSLLNLQRKAAGYFYLSTLGLNPASAMKNMLQLVLTTGPVVGFTTAAQGLTTAMKKSSKYFESRIREGLTHDDALRRVFPEFGEAGLVASPLTDEAVDNALRNAYEIAALPTQGKVAKASDKIKRGMMAFFSASETAVRVGTFEAGMKHATRSGMNKEQAIAFSKKLVEQTQFLTGPQNRPLIFLEGGRIMSSPLTSQLLQFPARMLEFTTSAAFTLGSGEKSWLGYNPYVFSRLIAGSVMASELGASLGMNIDDALISGALPSFQEKGKVFAPFPLVPPFWQIAGSLGIALTGDFSELLRATPLMVPGGVQAFRSAGFLPEQAGPLQEIGASAARWAERSWADYDNPMPDGRIPIYSGKGVLKGYFTRWQITKMGLGVPEGDSQKEQALLHFLTSQRDQIRDYRKQYLDAVLVNDFREAASIRSEFEMRYGFPLPVDPSHIEAVQMKRHVTRLEQVLQTVPAGPARDQMTQVLAATLSGGAQSLIGLPADYLSQPVAARNRRRSSPAAGAGTPYTERLAPLSGVRPYDIGKSRTLPMMNAGL